jgi:hypothetical protein
MGVERVERKDQLPTLDIGEPVLDQGEVAVFVEAVEFVADDGMAEVGEVESELVFASGDGEELEPGEGSFGTLEEVEHLEMGGCRGAIGSDGGLDGDGAGRMGTEGGVDGAGVGGDGAMDEGPIFLEDLAVFPGAAGGAGGCGIFGDEDQAAGFAVESVD